MMTLLTTRRALMAAFAGLAGLTLAQDQKSPPKLELPPIPADLIDNDHIREEFGVNEFTTPSIRRVFEDLDSLGTLPYDDLKRVIPKRVPPDRSLVALSTGLLIADGFLAVHSEKIDGIEDIGKAILANAESLGAKQRVTRHANSLLEGSLTGDWETLKGELAATQADVEAEMLLLRDAQVAHLVSLGGWVRAFHIATTASLKAFDPERAKVLARADIAAYYEAGLENLHPLVKAKPHMKSLTESMKALRIELEKAEGKTLTEAQVKDFQKRADAMVTALGKALGA